MRMPYKSVDELPDPVKKLGAEAQKMWLKVFNSAAKQYGDESRWFATAWAAVNKKYGKTEGSLVGQVDRLLAGGPP